MFNFLSNKALKITMVGGVLLIAGTAFGAAKAVAEEEIIGSDEFRISCVSCHGIGGKGNGPLAKYLTIKPTDLTQLSKNNNGKFPFLKVFHTVDGRQLVSGHGERAMPVWGARYQAEAGVKYGPYGGELAVRARVLELVFYIQAIQE